MDTVCFGTYYYYYYYYFCYLLLFLLLLQAIEWSVVMRLCNNTVQTLQHYTLSIECVCVCCIFFNQIFFFTFLFVRFAYICVMSSFDVYCLCDLYLYYILLLLLLLFRQIRKLLPSYTDTNTCTHTLYPSIGTHTKVHLWNN